jgi:hypothetical protein
MELMFVSEEELRTYCDDGCGRFVFQRFRKWTRMMFRMPLKSMWFLDSNKFGKMTADVKVTISGY